MSQRLRLNDNAFGAFMGHGCGGGCCCGEQTSAVSARFVALAKTLVKTAEV